MRTTRTDRRGVYTLVGLPPGTYRVAFEFEGFQRQERTVLVAAGAAVTLDIRLELAAIPQEVKVTRELDARPTREVAPGEAVVSGEALDRAPIGRTVEQAVLMTPGVSATGPSNALVMAGAFSYGNLFLVDGLVANDSTRGGARGFYFTDALQEIRVATSAIPVEFGRFQGGVVQVITRSGGNAFAGTLRITITNDDWRALTPYRGDATLNHRTPTWELTAGGPLVKQKAVLLRRCDAHPERAATDAGVHRRHLSLRRRRDAVRDQGHLAAGEVAHGAGDVLSDRVVA